MLGSEMAVKMLEKYGVKDVFGLPGDTSLAFYDALCSTDKINHVLCRDERHLGYMADAYARVSDRPGVCEVPSGGGVTYLAPALAEADGSSVPVISLASDVPLSSDEKNSLTALDQKAVISSLTRFSHRITQPNFIPAIFRKGFRMAVSGHTGPTHLTLPEDVLSGSVSSQTAETDCYAEEACKKYPAYRARANAHWVEKACELILEAKRPLIIAGGGVLLSRAWDELKELSEYLSIPVITSINGKGSVAETSPLALGVMGTNGAKPSSNQAAGEADVILAIGTRLNSSTCPPSLLHPQAKIIQADSDPSQLGNNVKTEVGLHGDAKLILQDLMLAVKDRCRKSRSPFDWVIQASQRVETDFSQMKKYLSSTKDKGYMHPVRPIHVLEELLPQDSILVLDAGYSTPFVAGYFKTKKAGRTFIDPRAQGSLGYALPAAIGVKIAKPDAPVVALFGDGSLGMSLGEMETVTRLKLPIIYIHFNNNSFGWIQNLQKIYCSERYFSSSFDDSVDYVEAARAHGLNGVRAETSTAFHKALSQALHSDQATFIEIPAPSAKDLTPLVAPWIKDEEKPKEERIRKSY